MREAVYLGVWYVSSSSQSEDGVVGYFVVDGADATDLLTVPKYPQRCNCSILRRHPIGLDGSKISVRLNLRHANLLTLRSYYKITDICPGHARYVGVDHEPEKVRHTGFKGLRHKDLVVQNNTLFLYEVSDLRDCLWLVHGYLVEVSCVVCI